VAVQPVIQIDVDSDGFDKFKSAFMDYDSVLKKQPAAWQTVNQRIVELAKVQRAAGVSADAAWKTAVAGVTSYERAIKSATVAQTSLHRMTIGGGNAMEAMAKQAKGVSHNLFNAVRMMAKLGGVGGLIAGGLGLGLDTLANNVVSNGQTARGLGLSVGQLNSWRANMRGIAGVGALQAASEAQMNLTQAPWITTLGIPWQQAQGEAATTLAGQEILAIHRAYKRNPVGFLNQPYGLAAQHLGFTPEDIRNIGNTPEAQLRAQISAVGRDASGLGLSAQMQREWQAFAIQMQKAGIVIENSIIKVLGPLTPQLGTLARQVAGMIDAMGKSGDLSALIKQFGSAVGDVTSFLYKLSGHPDLAKAAAGATAGFLLGGPLGATVGAVAATAPGKMLPGNLGGGPNNNPGNIIDPTTGKPAVFPTLGSGIRAMAALEKAYPKRYGFKTVAQILTKYKGKWHGPGDMTTAEYIKFITGNAGIDPNGPWPTDPKKVAATLHYQTVAEGHKITQSTIADALRKNTPASAYALANATPGAGPGVGGGSSQMQQIRNRVFNQGAPKVVIQNNTGSQVFIPMNAAVY
jgi:hypothetical protein